MDLSQDASSSSNQLQETYSDVMWRPDLRSASVSKQESTDAQQGQMNLSEQDSASSRLGNNVQTAESSMTFQGDKVWNTETFDNVKTSEEHSMPITDVRFKPNSTILATSSFDKTVRIWDAITSIAPPLILGERKGCVTSLDFHPSNPDPLCSCDLNDMIRYWNVTDGTCTRSFKGAKNKVRFQPDSGELLAAAAGKTVNVFDAEIAELKFSFEGHLSIIHLICWDSSGKYIVSVSKDRVRLWPAVTGGEYVHELVSKGNHFFSCTYHPKDSQILIIGYVHELVSKGNHFFSCTYHPKDSQILIIGGDQNLELWEPGEGDKTLSVEAHEKRVSALSSSMETKMVASASHDSCVKLWR